MYKNKILVVFMFVASTLTGVVSMAADFGTLTDGFVRDANAVVIGDYQKLSSYKSYIKYISDLKSQHSDIVATAGLATILTEVDGTSLQQTRITIYSRDSKGILTPIAFVIANEVPGDEFNLGYVVDLQFGKIN